MIKCTIVGSSADILKFKQKLCNLYKDRYPLIVTESIPEAVNYGTSNCTAVFILGDSFFDVNIVHGFYKAKFIINLKNYCVCKEHNSSFVKWSKTIEVSKS